MSAPASPGGSSASAASGSPQSQRPRSGAEAERRVWPRHFHAGPNPVASSAADDDAAAAAESDRLPPAARLYRDALWSIFAFLDQSELAMALQVSHSWLAAVKSMASLRLTMRSSSLPLRVVTESVMGRHVAELGTDDVFVPLTAYALFIVERLMPQLRVLRCEMQLTPPDGWLVFPSGLRELCLAIIDDPAAVDANAALKVVSRLPLLESFAVHLPTIDNQLSFAALALMPQLRDFRILSEDDDAELSDVQVDELRALPRLRMLDVQPMLTSLLSCLLTQPHELQWQQIGLPEPLDNETGTLLPRLPSLTTLDAWCSASQFEWLQQLPNLTHIDMGIDRFDDAAGVASLVSGLQCCTNIKYLSIRCPDLNAAHLTDLLPRLPRLQRLGLVRLDIDSLSFLAQAPMTHQLSSLSVDHCERLPLIQLRHVHALRGLTQLLLCGSFDVPMDPLSQSLHTPPSVLMPQLHTFSYSPPEDEDHNEFENEVDEDGGVGADGGDEVGEDEHDEVEDGEDEAGGGGVGDADDGADEVAADADEANE